MEEALDCALEAAAAAPDHAQAAFAVAQLSFETWRPAALLFAEARRLAPDSPDLIRNHALSLAAEGDIDAADALLARTLREHPSWLDGHRTLATLRVTSAYGAPFDESFAHASAAEPQNLSLRLAWFHAHAARKNWETARRVLRDAKAALPPHRQLEMAALFLDCESDTKPAADAGLIERLAAFDAARDPGMDLCRTRYLMRIGDVAGAVRIAERQMDGEQSRAFWPYLSALWRLQGEPRGSWLDRDAAFVAALDLPLSVDERATLAAVLRSLHRLRAPYPEQSVRGGTQTDRQLFFHPSAEIQSLRAHILRAVSDYVAALPEPDPRHPLLGPARDRLLFEGSWSVRLNGAGRHMGHTHVRGWISSAFYVSVPSETEMGPSPAGWLVLGAPPADLGLGLAPTAQFAPTPGRLVLFPSTTWHETEPYGSGERLTAAFDIAIPGVRPNTA